MHTSCLGIKTALSVFESIGTPDFVSWNSVIAGHSDINGQMAIEMSAHHEQCLFMEDTNLDEYTFAAIISATASLPSTCYEKPLHKQIIKV